MRCERCQDETRSPIFLNGRNEPTKIPLCERCYEREVRELPPPRRDREIPTEDKSTDDTIDVREILTEREQMIWELIVSRATQQEVADVLGVSRGTAAKRIARVKNKVFRGLQ